MTCRQCGIEKLAHEFYPRSAECKACACARVRANRLKNLEAVRAYDRDRARLPHRVENATRVTRNWRREHPDRNHAHNVAARAGIESPQHCEGCGVEKRLEKHHPDYSRPLLVVWLCKPCHIIADRIRRRLEAS